MRKADRRAAAGFFGHLANDIRLGILTELPFEPDDGRSVTELCSALREPQPKVSHQLGMLRRAGLVDYTQVGKEHRYHLTKGEEGSGPAGPELVLGFAWAVACLPRDYPSGATP